VDYAESASAQWLVLRPPFINAYKEMRQNCFVVAGVNDHSSLIDALTKYMDQESRVKEVVNAHEELKQQKMLVKKREEEENKAVEGLTRTDPRFECVRGKHKDNKRQRMKRQQQELQQLACVALHNEQTSPKRPRL